MIDNLHAFRDLATRYISDLKKFREDFDGSSEYYSILIDRFCRHQMDYLVNFAVLTKMADNNNTAERKLLHAIFIENMK